MRRVALLRSIEVQQAVPYLALLGERLAAEGIEARLFYTDGDCGPEDFPGEAVRLAPDVSCEEIVTRLRDWGADGAISVSIPDENALRDAVVKELLAEQGVPMVMHGAETTRLLANKWETKQLVGQHGLSTPQGILLDGDILNGRSVAVPAYTDLVTRWAGEAGYPLLSKPLWDCLANGISFLEGERELAAFLREPYDGNVVLERCVRGELCSVEIIGQDGRYHFQPLLWKGETGGPPSHAFDTVRYAAPRSAAEADFEPVGKRLRALCTTLGIEGALEVEMIYTGGRYDIIEINPRVSGSTTLSVAASDVNTYECLLDMLLGRWPAKQEGTPGGLRRYAFQFPVAGLRTADRLRERFDVIRASTFHVDGTDFSNVAITCEFGDEDKLLANLRELEARSGTVSAATIAGIEAAVTGALTTV